MKTVSQIDDQGRFIGSTTADQSPREPGVFLLPAGSVDAPPPNVPPGMFAQWNGSSFDLIAEPAPEHPEPEAPTPEQIILQYTAALEAMYDEKANERRYDNRFTCALRAGYPGPFQAEGIAFATWMDSCNALGYQILAEVQSGQRPVPTILQFLSEMPVMEWPQ
jgi:hypothetical protein